MFFILILPIPKVIHYCWFGGKPLPSDTKKYIDSWKKYCPDYEIKEWNENNFDVYSHPFMKAAYEAKAWAFVSDYARLKVIYDNGGIYLDTDVEIVKNLDFLLENEYYIGTQQINKMVTTGLGFGAIEKSEIVKQLMQQYDNLLFSSNEIESIACPMLNNLVFKKLGFIFSEEIISIKNGIILPCRFMDPISPGDTENLLCDDTISIHHYTASWTSNSTKLKRKIFNILGQERINYLKKIIKRKK